MKRQSILDTAVERFLKRRKSLRGFAYANSELGERHLNYIDLEDGQLHSTFSITKTVTAVAIGIVLKEKGLPVSMPLGKLFPKVLEGRTEVGAITIENILLMQAGFQWRERDAFIGDGPNMAWAQAENLMTWALHRPLTDTPGSVYNYDSMSSHILSGIITTLTGFSLDSYVNERVFKPLGITDYMWDKDEQGHAYGGHGLYLSLESCLRLGEAFVNTVQMEAWVGKTFYGHMKRGQNAVPFGPYRYGYHTWTGTLGGCTYFAAFGHGGQRIFCMADGQVLVTLGKIWPEFGVVDTFLEKWLAGEKL